MDSNAAERIRAGGGPFGAAPMVALTADAGDEERARAAKAGMDDFITKPIDANRLLQVAARFTEAPEPRHVRGQIRHRSRQMTETAQPKKYGFRETLGAMRNPRVAAMAAWASPPACRSC